MRPFLLTLNDIVSFTKVMAKKKTAEFFFGMKAVGIRCCANIQYHDTLVVKT